MHVFNERIEQRVKNKFSHTIKAKKLHLILVKLRYKIHINSKQFQFIKNTFTSHNKATVLLTRDWIHRRTLVGLKVA